MSETVLLAILTPTIAAIVGGVSWIVRELLATKNELNQKQEEEIKALRDKVNALQNEVLAGVRSERDTAFKQADTNQRVARSMEDQTALIAALSAKLAGKTP